uniref:Uncharacterized protein n=1 Tax=Paramormyrops kingsleyae TaxID=1676925 RepID=A0A3B3RTL7_9TELE
MNQLQEHTEPVQEHTVRLETGPPVYSYEPVEEHTEPVQEHTEPVQKHTARLEKGPPMYSHELAQKHTEPVQEHTVRLETGPPVYSHEPVQEHTGLAVGWSQIASPHAEGGAAPVHVLLLCAVYSKLKLFKPSRQKFLFKY